jgi:hypothetical protein
MLGGTTLIECSHSLPLPTLRGQLGTYLVPDPKPLKTVPHILDHWLLV